MFPPSIAIIMGAVMFIKAPDLLKKRLGVKEKENTQKGVVAFSALIFFGGFIVAGLDFRFGWKVSTVVQIIASALFLVSYAFMPRLCEKMPIYTAL